MGTSEEGSLNIVTLLLTGRATPYLHNGVIYVGDEDHYVRQPLPSFALYIYDPLHFLCCNFITGFASVRNFGKVSHRLTDIGK